tara:strand:+ start:134 stop:601 length:468 start_codon:yes stop_codon:yes gene_type:complete
MKRFFQLKNIAILLLLVAVLLMALLGEKFYDRMIREGMTNSDSDSSSVSGNVNVADYTNNVDNSSLDNEEPLEMKGDKYMLKSHVVPPVCPKCPDFVLNAKELRKKMKESCPPCPPCARCPEPSFDCKKVPNYTSSSVDNYLPKPMLTDFSNFSI